MTVKNDLRQEIILYEYTVLILFLFSFQKVYFLNTMIHPIDLRQEINRMSKERSPSGDLSLRYLYIIFSFSPLQGEKN